MCICRNIVCVLYLTVFPSSNVFGCTALILWIVWKFKDKNVCFILSTTVFILTARYQPFRFITCLCHLQKKKRKKASLELRIFVWTLTSFMMSSLKVDICFWSDDPQVWLYNFLVLKVITLKALIKSTIYLFLTEPVKSNITLFLLTSLF
jgi:hypothetical protein